MPNTTPIGNITYLDVDLNKSIIAYLLDCPEIKSGKLFFNFGDQKDNYKEIITFANDEVITRPYVDGSVLKRHTVLLLVYKSISRNAIVKTRKTITDASGTTIVYEDENVVDFAEANSIVKWIEEQDENNVYPYFGKECIVEKVHTLTNIPQILGVDSDSEPPLARYQIGIAVDYLDTSKMIWK